MERAQIINKENKPMQKRLIIKIYKKFISALPTITTVSSK